MKIRYILPLLFVGLLASVALLYLMAEAKFQVDPPDPLDDVSLEIAIPSPDVSEDISSYTLPHTEVRQVFSRINGIEYTLYISLPREYDDQPDHYPVVYTLDADYSFAIAHNTIEHFVDRNNLPEMIIVGIAYEGASQQRSVYRLNRSRDYTPTPAAFGVYGPEAENCSEVFS